MPCANETLTGLSLKLEKDPYLILQVSLIRALLVLSLCLQLGLLMSGYFRKMTNRFIVSLPSVSYVFYLAAEPATTTALTMILRSKEVRDDMPALLWTPLLLWYLGGPYNLTAYAVQDSETWTRHLVFFFIRLGTTLYTCYLLGMGAKTNSLALILVVVFMLLAGTIKYAEKIWALWSSTPPQMVSRIFFGRQEVVEWRDKQKLSDFLKKPRGEELRFLCLAYSSFMASMLSFLGLAHHHHHHSAIRDETLTLLHSSKPARAFRLLAIQLDLLHDTHYTKFSMPTIKHWRLSTNLIYILTLIASLLVFSTVIENHTNYVHTDIILTYLLLCGTILLECVSITMQIFSAWTMVSLDEWFITHLWPLKLRLKRLVEPKKHFHIGQHDLVQQCFKERPTRILMALALKFRNVSFVSTILTVKSTISRFYQSELVLIDEELEKYIYSYVTSSTNRLDCLIKQQQASVASSVLQHHDELHDFTELYGMSFIGLIFHFHIMTNVLYHREKPSDGGKMAKRLSDYMMYVALVRPLMLPEGLQGDVIYKTMIKEVNQNYSQKRGDVIGDFARQLYDGNLADEHSLRAGAEEEEENTFQYYKPLPLKTGGWLSKTLQSQLQPNSAASSVLEKQAWDNISRIWIDLLVYAAVCCGWKEHVTQLKDGGELLTYVALLMHHLGLHRKISPPL